MVGGEIPEQVVLGSRRKITEQECTRKPEGSVPPWLLLQFPTPGSCLEFLPCRTVHCNRKQTLSFLCCVEETARSFPGHPDPKNHKETVLITTLFGQ